MLSKVFNARRKELGTGINKRVSAAIETKDERALKAALVEMRALTAEEMSAVSEWVIACDNDEKGEHGVPAACIHAQLVLDAVLSSKFMNRELTKAIREGDLEELLALLHVVEEEGLGEVMVLSHCCHTVVTLLSHCCHSVVTLLLYC
jgi:hypothetical protein